MLSWALGYSTCILPLSYNKSSPVPTGGYGAALQSPPESFIVRLIPHMMKVVVLKMSKNALLLLTHITNTTPKP